MTSIAPTSYQDGGFSHRVPGEEARLHTLQRLWDPITKSALARLPVAPDWQCAEIAAGTGSIARHLAELVPHGSVVATEVDTRFLRSQSGNLMVLHHDVRTDDFPGDSFDLIHARALLEHLPERNSVLARLISWLRPGGWLVVESFDSSSGLASPHPPLTTVLGAMSTLMSEQVGSDFLIGRTLASQFSAAGLTDIDTEFANVRVGDHGAGEQFLDSTLQQLSPQLLERKLLTESDIIAWETWMNHPASGDIAAMLCIAKGRRPPHPRV
ncbi:class I SAM-dependent methyltransferase [Streptomyces xanthochromogenes]|uniref:class I SAM-dependent methyltransferase n=1 Tax=Streptomyces xanthochromogenes TaxID=67384 RepID=UPI0037F25982